MTEVSLEEVIGESAFAQLLQTESEMFFRLARTLRKKQPEDWGRRHLFQLVNEANDLESFLDDHGARYNRTFNPLRELTASLRGVVMAAFSVTHLERRLDSYGTDLALSDADVEEARRRINETQGFLVGIVRDLLDAVLGEAGVCGLALKEDEYPVTRFRTALQRKNLPRNMGQEELQDEEQKIAEVASKYLQACDMLTEVSVRQIVDAREREDYLRRFSSEEKARVYEATVHNLQSTYDTYIKNTVIEARDARLTSLRGHISAALHFLETVTHLAHLVERHESGVRSDSVDRRIDEVAPRERVRHYTLNVLLYWADRFMQAGRSLAEALLPTYTNVQELTVTLDDSTILHARPAALIVGIVNHYGTPVQLELEGHTCNAGSILELMVTVGSHPDAKRFTFNGDEHPLRDIALLFEHGLGESGIDALPSKLDYLRS